MFIIFQVGFRIWILVFDAIFDQTVEENKICPAVFSASELKCLLFLEWL